MKNYQSDFNRLRTTLFGGQADRVPLMELAIDLSIKSKFLGRPVLTTKDLVDFALAAGYDYIRLAPRIDFNPAKIPPKEGFRQTTATGLDQQRNWHAEGQGMITSFEDFENFQWPNLADVNYQSFEEARTVLPDELKIVGQYGDIFTWVWHFMGFKTFSFALVEQPELVQAMFQKVGSIVLELFQTMASFEQVGALFYSDDIAHKTGLLLAPAFFRKYLFPWLKKMAQLGRDKNIPFIYHSDGKIWPVLDDLYELGVNAIQPLEPQAIDIREVKRQYGQKFCLIGNIDVDLLSRGTPAQIAKVAQELIRDIGPGGGYCLGSGNTVPAYVPLENFKAMVEACWKDGAYMIKN